MKKKVENTKINQTTVSEFTNKKFRKNRFLRSNKSYATKRTRRGKVLHYARERWYRETLKTGSLIKISHTTLLQRARESKNKILDEIRKNEQLKVYTKDASTLLKQLYNALATIAKKHAKKHNWSIIPQEIEFEIFGGYVSFEQEESGMIDGIKIYARIDDLVEKQSENFIVREFKSYPLDGEDPSNQESEYYKDFVQACLYAIILEENSGRKVDTVELVYYPNHILSYEFTNELKNQILEFVRENSLDVLDFKVVTNDHESTVDSVTKISDDGVSTPSAEDKSLNTVSKLPLFQYDEDSLGYINTSKDKPLLLVNQKQNRLDGYLNEKRAELVKDGDLVAVEKIDGRRIICRVEEIRCHQGNVSGETTCFGTEKVFRIKLNPVMELHPEGPREPRPQTIIQGKITKLTDPEFYQFTKIPQHGILFGYVNDLDDQHSYYFNKDLFYQGVMMIGNQGTGKTSTIRLMITSTSQQPNSPSIIVFDAEREFVDLLKMPSTKETAKIMTELGLNSIDPANFEVIKFEEDSLLCLTLKVIDPKHLLLFLHELPPVSYTTVQRIIKDIKRVHPGKTFTFPELQEEILIAIADKKYRANSSVRDAIWRALQSVSLDLFDRAGAIPIDIENMLTSGKITVLDCFDLEDDLQRAVALYYLAVLHKHNIKKQRGDSGMLFILDEIQRIMPDILSSSDYQKRIIHFLSEIQHRGRKRSYGVIYATQHPTDIKKEIIDLCNTSIFFQMQGSGCTYLKEFLNKSQREQLKRLPEGFAYIQSKGKHEPVIIKFPFIN